MTVPYATPSEQRAAQEVPAQRADHDRSLGDLVGELVADVQKLLRQEVELAKAEVREEATKAGKAAGMLSGAAFAGYMVLVLVSLAAVFGLAAVMPAGWAALIVAAVWAVIGAVLFVVGRSRMRQVSPKPERTVETLKEDAQWARHPTR
ncbi:phage holin family protein [Streptomonospora nanhaiensis]|uniref:phage holin family protein n=1 Tax=Streptomonospora nanhaiensis TaxID=1323731 RepID=UPI001C387130|nr:phage holin family protein [Streptomonospora nanhaiensis]MBV2364214.1 phage holin family protein [Streptomonospora nanhaiensis]